MDALTALTSIMSDGAFEADVNGNILRSNAPFVQLLRRVPGDNWRNGVADEDRTLIDTYWDALFLHPELDPEPVMFRVLGGDQSHQLRARCVVDDAGNATSAVGVILHDENPRPGTRFELDPATGLPDRMAALHGMDELAAAHRAFTLAVVVLNPEDAGDDTTRKEAARLLLAQVRPADIIAGSVDGTFLVCAADLVEDAAAKAFTDRMSIALLASDIAARIGYATPSEGVASATLVREAEAGAYTVEPGEVGRAL